MHGLHNAQRTYDHRLPDDGKQRGEREFRHPESAPAGANVIRSSKVVAVPMSHSGALLDALQQIMRIAEQSQFQAVSLVVLREIAGPVIKKAKGESK